MKFFTGVKIFFGSLWVINQILRFYLQVDTDWMSVVGSFATGFMVATLIPEPNQSSLSSKES
jgi:hypothetical protein